MSKKHLYEKIKPLEKGFPIKFRKGSGAYHIHWHEYMELLYYLSDGRVFCNGKSFNVSKGELAVANPSELHNTIEGEYYCLRIAPSFFSDVAVSEINLLNHIHTDGIVAESFENIYREYTEKKNGYLMEIKSLVYHMVRYLLTSYAASEQPSRVSVDTVIDSLGFISDNYAHKISTSDICNHLNISENYFAHIFRRAVGYTPVEYINNYRIEKAAELLLATGMSITDIAQSVGIEDSNYFSRVFKRRFGVSPREYRIKNT